MGFVEDTFTAANGTLLTAHTPDVGGSWIKHGSSLGSPSPSISSNKLAGAWDLYSGYYNNQTPPTADYSVTVDVAYGGGIDTTSGGGVFARLSSASTLTCYLVRMRSNAFVLQKIVSGTSTTLGSVSYTPSTSSDYRLTLTCDGDAISVKCQRLSNGQWINSSGSEVGSETDMISVTDTGVTAAGFAGIAGRLAIYSFDNFEAVDLNAPIEVDAESTISLSDEASAVLNAENVSASSELVMSSFAANILIEGDRSIASSELDLESIAFSPSHPGVAQDLNLVQEATAQLLTTFQPSSDLGLSQQATGSLGVPWLPIQVTSTIELTQEVGRAIPAEASSTLSLTSEGDGAYGISSTMTLTQSATAGVLRELESELAMTQTVSRASSIFNRSITSTLVMTSAGNAYNPSNKCFKRDGARTGPTPAKMKLTLRSLDGANEVVLRNPEQDNIRRVAFERVLRETRGGELTVFTDPNWPTLLTLQFTVVSTKASVIESLQQFLLDTLGEEIQLIDWLGEQFIGVVTRPDEPFVEDREGYWTFGFEFQGHKSESNVTSQNLNLVSAASATLDTGPPPPE